MADKQKNPTVDGASTPADSQPSDTNKTPLINEDTTGISSEPTPSSLFGKIQDVQKSCTVGCTITIGLAALVPVAMIVIGAIYKDDCPLENMIPIYLIVGGTVGASRLSLEFCNRITTSGEEEGGKVWLTAVLVTLDCFSFIWFICGNVWVFKNYEPHYNTGIHDDRYCDKTVYLFSFWLIIVFYIIIVAILVALCCAAIFAALIPVKKPSE